MKSYSANDTVLLSVQHSNGEYEELNATLSDKYDYYIELGWSKSNLESMNISQGQPFLGIEGLSSATAGVDRLAGLYLHVMMEAWR